MEFIDKKLEEYSENHTTAESAILYDLNRTTNSKVLQPRMLSGHLQGRLLSMLSKMIAPKRILEIGTYTGYSAICMAEGLSENGKLITIDINYELEDLVKTYIHKAGFEHKIIQKVGDALEIIPTLNERFDLVFIDADKDNYLNYYNMIFPMLNEGGYIIADNVLWSGKVLEPEKHKDTDTQTLLEFNKTIQADIRVENILLPIRDGLMVVRKL
jgi:predicted O-methyltransferase YrrM